MQRAFGSTGLTVSVLGLGAGQVGLSELTESEASALLNGALDAGVVLIDTARGYGLSEERIGRHLSKRRDEFVLSTKGGYDIEGTEDWSAANIAASVDRALRLTRTDRLDIFHLHSCPVEVLERGDLIDELQHQVQLGKVRVPAYSGDNEALSWAADSRRFGSVETSVNVADQWSLRNVLPRHRGLGVIAKRPIANAAWLHASAPDPPYAELYWQRLQQLALDRGGLEWDEYVIRFSAYAPGVHTAIVSTRRLANLQRNAELVARGPLPDDLLAAIDQAWRREGADWPGDV
jgi:aryl-alcohol dehydrogenase-like predicted oxidoreductase